MAPFSSHMRVWVSDVGFSMGNANTNANTNGPRFARTSLRSDFAALGPRFARRRPNLKNTESFRSWSFSTRNDRKEILRCLRGNIDFTTFLVEVGFFGKSVNFRKVVYPPRMSPFGLKIRGDFFQTILQNKVFPERFLVEVGFFETNLKFWKAVYPPRMSPFGLKTCGRVFHTILQKYFSQEFFG